MKRKICAFITAQSPAPTNYLYILHKCFGLYLPLPLLTKEGNRKALDSRPLTLPSPTRGEGSELRE